MSGSADAKKYRVKAAEGVCSTTNIEVVTSQPGACDDSSEPLEKLPPTKVVRLPEVTEKEKQLESQKDTPAETRENSQKGPSSPPDSKSSPKPSPRDSAAGSPMLSRKSLRAEPPKLVRLTSSFQLEKYGRAWHRFEPLPEITRGEVEIFSGRNGHWLHKPYLKQYWKGVDACVMVREPTERRSAWTELFFDLVFIVVFHHLAQDLMVAHPIDGRAVGEFIILAVCVWRIWISLVTYIDRFRPVDSLHIAYYYIQMIFIMSYIIQSVNGVIFSYLAARAVTELAYIWAAYHCPEMRKYTVFSVGSFCISALPWGVSYFFFKNEQPTPEPGAVIGWVVDKQHIILWTMAQVIENSLQFFVPAIIPSLRLPSCIEHMTERHGLLVMLALGEQVMSFIFKDYESTLSSFVTALVISSVVIYTTITYFYVESGTVKLHAIRRSFFHEQAYIFLHVPFLCAMLSLSAAEHLAVAGTLKTGPHLLPHHIASAERWLFCLSITFILLCLAAFGLLHVGPDDVNISKKIRVTLRVLFALLILTMGFFSEKIPTFAMYSVAGGLAFVLSLVELHGSKSAREANEVFEPDFE